MTDTKQLIFMTIDDLITDFLYYDRKEDQDLPRDAIEDAIKEGVITKQQIIDRFKSSILNGLEDVNEHVE